MLSLGQCIEDLLKVNVDESGPNRSLQVCRKLQPWAQTEAQNVASGYFGLKVVNFSLAFHGNSSFRHCKKVPAWKHRSLHVCVKIIIISFIYKAL